MVLHITSIGAIWVENDFLTILVNRINIFCFSVLSWQIMHDDRFVCVFSIHCDRIFGPTKEYMVIGRNRQLIFTANVDAVANCIIAGRQFKTIGVESSYDRIIAIPLVFIIIRAKCKRHCVAINDDFAISPSIRHRIRAHSIFVELYTKRIDSLVFWMRTSP